MDFVSDNVFDKSIEGLEYFNKIPKILWMYWDRGIDEAPWLVREIVLRWRKCLGNDWKIVFLDQESVKNYIDIPMEKSIYEQLSKAHQADLIRLLLLEKYGGVWCDATVFCNTNPDLWLPDLLESGFFAFEKPTKSRPISNWFLVAEPGHYIVRRLREEFVSFFETNKFGKPGRIRSYFVKKATKRIEKLGPKYTRVWFSYIMTNIIRVYPYFTFHYLFNKLLEEDDTFRSYWNATPKVSAGPLHRLKRYGLQRVPDQSILQTLKDQSIPLYKLDWKNLPASREELLKESVLFGLFEKDNKEVN